MQCYVTANSNRTAAGLTSTLSLARWAAGAIAGVGVHVIAQELLDRPPFHLYACEMRRAAVQCRAAKELYM